MKTRSNTQTGTLTVAALAVGAAIALGQPVGAAPDEARGRERGERRSAMSLKRLTATLSLTPQQQAQLKPVLENARARRKALRDNTTLSPEEKKAQMRAARVEMRRKMNAILTPAQKQKLRQMKQNRAARPSAERRGA